MIWISAGLLIDHSSGFFRHTTDIAELLVKRAGAQELQPPSGLSAMLVWRSETQSRSWNDYQVPARLGPLLNTISHSKPNSLGVVL